MVRRRGGVLPPIERMGLKTYPLPPDKAVEFKHALKPGRYLVDFSLGRVGIAESVPPPRLLVGFAKDRRRVDSVRVQDETAVYRAGLGSPPARNLVHVPPAPPPRCSPPFRPPHHPPAY